MPGLYRESGWPVIRQGALLPVSRDTTGCDLGFCAGKLG